MSNATTGGRMRSARGRTFDLGILALIGVLLFGALAAGTATLYRGFYSPSAFVLRYLSMLESGRAADALAMPGVTLDGRQLTNAGLPQSASDALLRSAALGDLDDAEITGEVQDGDTTIVSARYEAGGHRATTSFRIARNGTIGLAPSWRFAQSPLAVMKVSVAGSMTFEVNSFSLDKRQVSPEGADADPLAPVSMLVFSPGLYSISVDTPIAKTPGMAVLADAPMVNVPVTLQAEPTQKFIDVVQQRVEEFLTNCTSQQVLQPTGCPFGFVVRNRVEQLPKWTITEQPEISVVADGAGWRIPDTAATAHIDLTVRSLFDGALYPVAEDVPFVVNGTISVLPDGTASIRLGGSDLD
ncbi:hypothetical protein [Microbacterium sp. cx-59]|uniref:hypothetical protein n=1 Tax=Microbacterium sp. cx-59 TaxID=2891207 RepID=UPI001E38FBFC|nr:hypothetical protein [Microbacterium sp. cx-59]MCC4909477.1 hypothetical protein [Microbacterium sp. cx-59]